MWLSIQIYGSMGAIVIQNTELNNVQTVEWLILISLMQVYGENERMKEFFLNIWYKEKNNLILQ